MIVSPPNDSPRQFRTDNMGTSPSKRQTHRIFTSTWWIFWPLLNIWWKLIKCQLFRRRTSNFQLHQVAPPPRNHKSSPPHIAYYQQQQWWCWKKVVVLSAKNICGKYCPSKCQKEKERWLPIGFESIELNWNAVLAARTVVGGPTTHWIWNWVRYCQLPSGVWLSVSAFALLLVCLVHFLSLCVIVILKESQISSLFRSLLLNFFGSQGWFPISKT